ncbi:DUF2333 family protein [Methylohalobius crimeensis]|uniref:DUF2333 family protein n=1 Tax=Methylohalobius crimeensis TaxID=244365 RepID=UPI0003B610B6|nr:DUF2333 family protein [Methylohalobius crimeensis]
MGTAEGGLQKRWIWILAGIAGGVAFIMIAVGWYWTYQCFYPDMYDVTEAALNETGLSNPKELGTGARTTAVLIHNMEYLLTKPGGYLANDVTPPSVFLDNMPSWEYGVVVASRDLATALRNHFSRAQSQSAEDPDLGVGEPYYYFETTSWILPPTEMEYQKGIEAFRRYLGRLQEQRGPFYPRADNLSQYIDILSKRLGAYAQLLTAAAGSHHEEPAVAVPEESGASVPLEEVSWFEVDNHLYEARGYCWALLHIMRAIQRDFGTIIRLKEADEEVKQIIRELESIQDPVLSPVVLNGNGLGVFANYSLTIATYVSHTTSALIDLRALLKI